MVKIGKNWLMHLQMVIAEGEEVGQVDTSSP